MTEIYHQPELSIPELLESLQAPQPTVVAFEGGPCGGKTTIVNELAAISAPERPVAIVPEAATQHIEKLAARGISIPYLLEHDREGFLALEADILGSIITNIEETKRQYAGTNAIIMADRSDIGAYVTAAEYHQILQTLGRSNPLHLDLVDKMVYLPSLAREDAGRYTELMSTNTARYESADDAVATCVRNLGAVAMHPELSIHWGGEFTEKVTDVCDEVLHPEREVEAKFTLDPERLSYELVPDVLKAVGAEKLASFAISQSYHQYDGEAYRLRRTQTERGHTVYHYTVKTGEGSVRHELQRTISREQYNLLSTAPSSGELQKVRERYLINLPVNGALRRLVLSADYYSDRNLSVLEVEGLSDDQITFDIPGFNRGGVPAKELVQ